MKNGLILLIAFLMIACMGKSRKMTLEGDITQDVAFNPQGLVFADKIVNSGDVTPASGVKYKGVRKADPSDPPVVFDFTTSVPEKKFDLSSYCSEVEYIKLGHPMAGEGVGFIGGKDVRIIYPSGSGMQTDFISKVFITGEYIVAGDPYGGYHCYDASGKYVYTLYVPEKLPDYGEHIITVRKDTTAMELATLSVHNDMALILSAKGWNKRFGELNCHNFKDRSVYVRPYSERGGQPFVYDSAVFITYSYHPVWASPVFISSLDMKTGDTLSVFKNYNPKPLTDQYLYVESPDNSMLGYYNGKLSVRQAYSDTVYRVETPSVLEPAYVMNFGDKRMNIQTDYYGDRSGRLIPVKWLETDKFVYIGYTEGENTEANRQEGKVKFFNCYYDKADKKLYRMPGNEAFDKMLFESSSVNAIPVLADNARYACGKVYTVYSKSKLESVIDSENFARLPKAQQKKLRSLYEDLGSGELLLVVFK